MPEDKKSFFIFSILLLGGILFFANNHILTISIPLYSQYLGFDLSIIGYINATMGGMIIIVKLLTPAIFKKYSIKTIVVISYIFLIGITASFLSAKSGISFIILRTLYGIPFSLFPFFYLLLVKKISTCKENIVKYTSIAGLAMPTSMIISPLIAENLIQNRFYKTTFLISLIFSLLSFAFLALSVKFAGNEKKTPENNSKSIKNLHNRINIKTLLVPLIAFAYLGALDMMVLNYFPIIAQNKQHVFSHYFIFFSLSMIITQIFIYKCKMCLKTTLYIGYIFLTVSQLLIVFSYFSNYYLLSTVSAIFFGCGFSLVETNTNSLILLKSNENNFSYFMTAQQMLITVGRTVTPYLISSFAKTFHSVINSFAICAFIGIIPVFMLIIWSKKTKGNL
ncbi:MAG: MFS transporter [Spirochaetales bacterium]